MLNERWRSLQSGQGDTMNCRTRIRHGTTHLLELALMATTIALMLPAADAYAADPKVPPGQDPGGEPIALITRGIDYTEPLIAARLARDGEGELIGWDVVEDDRFPYAADNAGDTGFVRGLVAVAPGAEPLTLLPVRADPADPVSLAKALAFVTRTPARKVLVPFWSTRREDWEPFLLAARLFKDLSIIVPACAQMPAGTGAAVYPRDLGAPNIVFSKPGDGEPSADWIGKITDLPCDVASAR